MIPTNKRIRNQKKIQEHVLSWLWVILAFLAALYLRWLLSDIHTETTRLIEEREKMEAVLETQEEKIEELQIEFQAQIEKSIRDFIQLLQGKEEYPSYKPLPP